MLDPTVYIVIGRSAIARDSRGELIETVEWNDVNQPLWEHGGICDHRGGGGQAGYALLDIALRAAEANAYEVVGQIDRLSSERR